MSSYFYEGQVLLCICFANAYTKLMTLSQKSNRTGIFFGQQFCCRFIDVSHSELASLTLYQILQAYKT